MLRPTLCNGLHESTPARCSATIWMRSVLPHPAMLPNGPGTASPKCSRAASLYQLDYAKPPLSCPIDKAAFPSGPANAAVRSVGDGKRGATRSQSQRLISREHGDHRTFPAVSTVAHSGLVGGVRRHLERFANNFSTEHHFMCQITPPVSQPAL